MQSQVRQVAFNFLEQWLQGIIPDGGHQSVSLVVWMDTIAKIAPGYRVVHINVADVPALGTQATDYGWYGVIVRDDLRIQPGITERSDLGDDNASSRQRRCDKYEERLQALWRGSNVIVLDDIVGADLQKDDLRLIFFQPYYNVGRDLVDAPAWMTFVRRIGKRVGATIS